MKNEEVNLEALEALADQLFEERETLLDTLRDLRKRQGLTQAQVAERMGVSQPCVSDFEHYDANPTIGTILRYALAVNAHLNLRAYDAAGVGAGWTFVSSREGRFGRCATSWSAPHWTEKEVVAKR